MRGCVSDASNGDGSVAGARVGCAALEPRLLGARARKLLLLLAVAAAAARDEAEVARALRARGRRQLAFPESGPRGSDSPARHDAAAARRRGSNKPYEALRGSTTHAVLLLCVCWLAGLADAMRWIRKDASRTSIGRSRPHVMHFFFKRRESHSARAAVRASKYASSTSADTLGDNSKQFSLCTARALVVARRRAAAEAAGGVQKLRRSRGAPLRGRIPNSRIAHTAFFHSTTTPSVKTS